MRLPGPIVLLALVAAAGWPGAAEEAASRPPIALFAPAPETPLETAGTGIAPEVALRARVDAAGRVSEVVVLGVAPASDFDALFAESVRQAVGRWRYAPALEDGRAVPAELRWTVQFAEAKAPADGTPAEPTSLSAGFVAGEASGSQRYRQRVLGLPLDQRRVLLERLAQVAHGHLDPQRTTKFLAGRFVVYTDAPDPEIAAKLGNNLEATFNVLEELLGPALAPQPEPYRIVVFLYASQRAFDAFKRESVGLEWASGFYNPLGLVAFHMQMPSNQALLDMMLHEATHAYLDRYVVRPGVLLPRWLDEGLADYMGSSEIRKGTLIPGKVRRRDVLRGSWGVASRVSSVQFGVDEIRRALRGGRPPRLAALLDAEREDFYGESRETYYALAWLFVHFLRHGGEDWATQRFPDLLLYAAEGYTALDAFRAIYGEPAAIEPAFREYVLGL